MGGLRGRIGVVDFLSRELRGIMRKFKCTLCKAEFDESEAVVGADGVLRCPICNSPFEFFKEIGDEGGAGAGAATAAAAPAAAPVAAAAAAGAVAEDSLAYPASTVQVDEGCRYMAEIHQMAVSGESIIEAMGLKEVRPGWDDILFLGAQLDPMPLEPHEEVCTTTVLGKNAAKPLVLESPVYVSHMSFGALSRETKTALAKGAALAKTAVCSGEGGIVPEERQAAYQYIFEYVPNLYSVTPENLKAADAIEIKIGQGTKPGLGGHLPGTKVTPEIAAVRGKPEGQDIHSPSRFTGIENRDDLKGLVARLRAESEGRPIGIKIAAGRIERDLAFCVYAEPDFITIDGRGGATAASPRMVRDATSVPTIYALHRARKFLDAAGVGNDIALVITGGLRVSADFVKALAMGADAVAVATSAMMAAACQQYRICGSGYCPVGMATQDPAMRKLLDVEAAAKRVGNFFNVSLEELKTFARLSGHSDLRELSVEDLCTISREVSLYTDVPHA